MTTTTEPTAKPILNYEALEQVCQWCLKYGISIEIHPPLLHINGKTLVLVKTEEGKLQ